MKSAFLCDNPNNIPRVYSDAVIEKIEIDSTVFTAEDVRKSPEAFRDTEYLFSTWGMPVFTEAEIRQFFPALKAVFYGAGTVQAFARPFLNCGIRIFSAWAANGVPVAECTVAQIILANKGFFSSAREMKHAGRAAARDVHVKYGGNFDQSVGLIGVGMIGSMVAQRLKDYRLQVLAYDPFLPPQRAAELGVTLCSLEDLFSQCSVVSNHLANNAQTQGMLNYALFSRMPAYATFLNTGRGAQVVEDDLVKVLGERPDLTAILDVTFPEPPVQGHPFYTLPNCILTPHIAGSSGNETRRMGEYMAKEYASFLRGTPCRYEVSLAMLETMA